MNNYKLSDKGESLLKSIEALALEPYDDQKGINTVIKSWCKGATIGFGHLITSQTEFNKYIKGVNEQQANELFESDISPFVNCVNKVISHVIIMRFVLKFGIQYKTTQILMQTKPCTTAKHRITRYI